VQLAGRVIPCATVTRRPRSPRRALNYFMGNYGGLFASSESVHGTYNSLCWPRAVVYPLHLPLGTSVGASTQAIWRPLCPSLHIWRRIGGFTVGQLEPNLARIPLCLPPLTPAIRIFFRLRYKKGFSISLYNFFVVISGRGAGRSQVGWRSTEIRARSIHAHGFVKRPKLGHTESQVESQVGSKLGPP
jgi:hypothetical protein